MGNFVINRYLISEFLQNLFQVILIFSAAGVIMNLFEEINYFKNYDIGIGLPTILSFMVIPSTLLNILPFILFLSSMMTLIKLKNNRDILSLKTFGYSNFRFLLLFSITAFFVGALTLIAINPITSIIVKYYEDIRGKYEIDKSHLASITSNGLWIKENINSVTSMINAEEIKGTTLNNITIYKFDKNNVVIERIGAKTADISNYTWIIEDGYKIKFGETNVRQNFKTLKFKSTYNKDKLNSIYSNLDTISFYHLVTKKKELIEKGYNSKLLDEKMHFYLSLPFFLVLMVILAGIFTLNSNERRQNTYYIFLSILACAVIFYFKNFSSALGITERLPLILSVWAPIIILTLFCSVAIIQINEK